LDWYHAKEHLTDAAKLICGDKPEDYMPWLKVNEDHLYLGNATAICDAITAAATKVRNKELKKKITAEATYFTNNRERILYKHYRDQGLPIGSGIIEGGIKQLVNRRIKGTEKHWIAGNGNNILKLRIDEVGNGLHHLCQLYENAA
jgi:hypothetical protein